MYLYKTRWLMHMPEGRRTNSFLLDVVVWLLTNHIFPYLGPHPTTSNMYTTWSRIWGSVGHCIRAQCHKQYNKVCSFISIKGGIYSKIFTRPISSSMVCTSRKWGRESSPANEAPHQFHTKLSAFEERYKTATKSNEDVLSKSPHHSNYLFFWHLAPPI